MIQKVNKRSIWWGRFVRYGPLLFWFGLIFYASTDNLSNENTSKVISPFLNWLLFSPSEATIEILHIIIRKAAHFTEYGILAFFLVRALKNSNKLWVNNYWFSWSLAMIMVYALLDEYHQSFVVTRVASIYDSLIDISGGLVLLSLFKWSQSRNEPSNEKVLQQN